MASKVNSKFIVVLTLVVLMAVGVMAALYLLYTKNNSARNIAQGDEAYAAGELERAFGLYGKAVHAEPGNMQYLGKLEGVLLQMRPKTADEAEQLYDQYLQLLKHAAIYNSHDPQTHLRLLRELYSSARQAPYYQRWWEMMGTAGADMWQTVDAADPDRVYARMYQALSTFKLATHRPMEEVSAAEQYALDVIDAHKDSDLGWATLCMGQMAIFEKYRAEARARSALEAQDKKIDETIEKAVAAVPNGPEVAKAQLYRLISKWAADHSSVAEEQVSQCADRLITLLSSDQDPGLISEASDNLTATPVDGIPRALQVLERYLKDHPKAYDKGLRFARLKYLNNELDAADAAARELVNAEQAPTGFISRAQFELRKQAAGILVDTAFRRWDAASEADKPAQLKATEVARDKLVELVIDPVSDPAVLKADGKIAVAKGDFNKAANCFERLSNDPRTVDPEVLIYSAIALEQVGQIGRAYERMCLAMTAVPSNTAWTVVKARMEVTMGRFDDAATTMAGLPPEELSRPENRQLVEAINTRSSKPALLAGDADPTTAALRKGFAELDAGETETARATMLSALANAPENLSVLHALAQLEWRAGQADKAREYLDRAMAIKPDDLNLKRLDAIFSNDDPIKALAEYHQTAVEDEVTRTLSMIVSLTSLAHQQNILADQMERNEDAAGAAKARDTAARAKVEAKKYEARAEQIAGDHPVLIEYQFSDALTSKDWPRAEKVAAKAASLNTDQADGLYFKGRVQLARGNAQEAVRSLEIATDRVNYSAPLWRALAIAYTNLQNVSQALRAYEHAYRCNPNDLDGVRGYLSLLIRRGDSARALDILRTVRNLAPEDKLIRDFWLDLEADIGDKALALKRRREIYKDDPDDRSNALGLARMLGNLEPTREMITDERREPVATEQRWAHFTVDERMQLVEGARDGWRAESDTILDRLAASGGDELRLAVLRAQLLKQRGQISEGENILDQFIVRHTDQPTAQMYLELASYQAQSSHFTEAIKTFKEGVKHQDPQKREVDQELSVLLMQLQRYQQALEHLDSVLTGGPNPEVQKQRVECLAKLRRFEDAERSLQEIVKVHGDDDVTSMLAATVAEGRGDELWAKADQSGAARKYLEQREALARAESRQPSNPKPRILLAYSLVNEYRRNPEKRGLLDDAMEALQRADAIRADVPEVALARVTVLKVKGDRKAAIGELRRFLDTAPEHAAARRELVNLYLEEEQFDSAVAVIDEAIAINPTLAAWHEAKGDLFKFAKRDAKGALAAYTQADELAPGAAILLKVIDAAFAVPGHDCLEIVKMLMHRSAEMDAVPLLRESYARALQCAGKPDDARAQAKLAFERRRQMIADGHARPSDIEPWFRVLIFLFPSREVAGTVDASAAETFALELVNQTPGAREQSEIAELWLLSGDPEAQQAIERQNRAIGLCPPDDKTLFTKLHLDLANILLLSRHHQEAADAYQVVLKNEPDNVNALNNLAFVLAEDLKDPVKALPFAERAMQLAPNDASILDTVGWIHFLADDMEKAELYLKDSLKRAPRAAATNVHMAQFYLKKGDLDAAQQHLDTAEKSNPDAGTRQKIESLKDDIRKGRTPGG